MRTYSVLLAAVVAVVPAPRARAESDGITGHSGKQGATCADCHTGAPIMLAMWYTGPTNLKPGQKATYQLTAASFSMSPPRYSGADIAASGGTLAVNAVMAGKLQLVNKELTHVKNTPPIGTWTFDWTAPAMPGVYTIYGALLYADGTGTNTGDVTNALPLAVRVGTCNVVSDCDDGDACTTDACNVSTHACRNTAIDGCCNLDSECEDGDPCTANVCQQHTCMKSLVPMCCRGDTECFDTDACTKDACDQTTHRCTHDAVPGCCHVPADCDDGNACTTDTCSALAPLCVNTPIPSCCTGDGDCADNDPCTTDTCGTGGLCTNVLRADCCRGTADCDDGDVCTIEGCTATVCTHTPLLGCCHDPADCDDGYACTTETCTNNVCVFTPVPGCAPPDAGVPDAAEPDSDAAAPLDAGSADAPLTHPADTGPQPDAKAPAGDGPAPKKIGGGGGCQLEGGASPPVSWPTLICALALLCGATRRVRRRRR